MSVEFSDSISCTDVLNHHSRTLPRKLTKIHSL